MAIPEWTTVDVLRELEAATACYPEQRVGQIIANALRFAGGYGNCDPFYVTNEKLAEFLKQYRERVSVHSSEGAQEK